MLSAPKSEQSQRVCGGEHPGSALCPHHYLLVTELISSERRNRAKLPLRLRSAHLWRELEYRLLASLSEGVK